MGVAKKQKLLGIPQATMEMLARCVATLKPPPELTLSQWADRYRMLSAESSAEPGRWHTDKAPYQREIMDAIGDAHIRRVVIMCAAQLGKTELLLNILGYFMAYAPAPILVMQPTLDMGQTFSKDRLAPMIRDTPVLRGLVDVKSRYAGNTILKKNFPGGHITIVGANSATGLASRPIKVLLADEVDRYPGSAGTEGDPLSLAQKRQTTFWDKKTVMVSTPVIKGHSRIETEYNQSTREEWNVPCPECGHYQPFVWANLIFDPDDLQKEIVYKCERCGCVANEYRWKQQSQQGRFVAENPGAETRGFHLNTLASTFCGWKEIVQKFIVAKEQLDQGYGKATNRNTIGIEVCSTNDTGKMTVANDSHWRFTDKVVSNLVELVKYLMAEYGIDAAHVIRHYDVNGKPCPGIIGWNEDTGSAAKWAAFKARLGAATPGGQTGGSTNTGTATGNTALTYKVGDIVQFAGGKHYANSQATSGTTVKPGQAKVTAVAPAGKHPYHIVHTDSASTVYGWVDAAAITGKASATPAAKTYTVKAGDSLWRIAAQQLGNGARYKEIKTMNGLKNNTIHAGQVLKLPN